MANIKVKDYTTSQMTTYVECINMLKAESTLTDNEIIDFLHTRYSIPTAALIEGLEIVNKKVA